MNEPETDPRANFYTIHIADYLDADWAEWFDGMVLTHPVSGDSRTILTGYLRDQAELYGVLMKMRNLNLTLVSVHASYRPAR